MTVRYRHPQTGEVFEGKLVRIIPEVRSLEVRRLDPIHDVAVVVHLSNVIFITTPSGHKVFQ